MAISKALVVDDDPLSREFLVEVLRRCGLHVLSACDGRAGLDIFQREEPDIVFTDLRMPGMSGIDLLEKAAESSPAATIILTTAFASVQSAVEAMRKGAYDYLVKPFSPDEIEALLGRVKERAALKSENEYLRREVDREVDAKRIITVNSRMTMICQEVERVAKSKATVLIQGESGAGKELIARAIHEKSPRASRPFIKVNCAALAETLLESELFGHEKGAFTGAVSRREGRFELAEGGSLLLDEVSEISPSLQAKLLRVLEEEEFERVGGSHTIRADVRIIATTNRDLAKEIQEGRFRQDLYYRLNVVPIRLLPLRERPDDIPPLVQYFLKRFSAECGVEAPVIPQDVMDRLMAYRWPGNVRELRNFVHRMVVVGRLSDLPDAVPSPQPELGAAGAGGNGSGGHGSGGNGSSADNGEQPQISVGTSLEDAERMLILQTLKKTHGNRTQAADILKVTTRTLRNKLQTYRIRGFLS
ncbi:MAG TPA: sigma-54 dependent transcriptional regulator [Candidatus Brocadiia bacterium]|nr:sigma-54 dependent transcriptional regulator [Candidatus Brocadiia bacterium]